MGVYWVASNSVSLLGEVSCRGGGGVLLEQWW